jgi:hypothetical protein
MESIGKLGALIMVVMSSAGTLAVGADVVGVVVGTPVVGAMVGPSVVVGGVVVGSVALGDKEETVVGVELGAAVAVGDKEEAVEGVELGAAVGEDEGDWEGSEVVGLGVASEGVAESSIVGLVEGKLVGAAVQVGVGAADMVGAGVGAGEAAVGEKVFTVNAKDASSTPWGFLRLGPDCSASFVLSVCI